ncbi:MAG: Mfa1 family fimbria major subunit [Prevotellaceae bacterium]|nr:Mfa1 family fimbria major subunit [Prevotellaceae bacterium]
MKIKNLFLSMIAGLAFIGCSNEEDFSAGNNGGELGEPQFLTVNLVTNSTNETRAEFEGDPNKAKYEEGLETENKVTKVRFYFFDENDKAANVRKEGDSFKNYLDWTDVSEAGKDMPNVEKILGATLIIQTPKGEKTPDKVVAIINPTTENANETLSLTDLGDIAGNYQTYTSDNFVMSNSTYADNGSEKMAVSVAGKIKDTAEKAYNDPVQIYVERTVAKVRLNNSLEPKVINIEGEGEVKIFKTSTDETKQEYDGEEIYVRFLGWNTTAVTDKSRLVKKINPEWADNLFGNTPWNWADYHRSFWAINATDLEYQYGAFVSDTETKKIDGNLFQAQAMTKFDKSQWVYINENASDVEEGDDPTTPTKVIIAAQLVDENGSPLQFAEYGSKRTTIDGLKNLFADNCGLYRKETTKDENGLEKITFIKITPAELTIKTATVVGAASQTEAGRYKSYVQLAKDEDGKWYTSNSKDAVAIDAEKANQILKDLGSAKVWTDGYTYYYFDIKHLGNKTGVVRNHIYDANITKLTGLGTPVYDPEEIIYPEKPEKDTDTFIAAQINILSWRIVSNDYELNW